MSNNININNCINYIKKLDFSIILKDIKTYNYFNRIINNISIKFIAKGTQGIVYLYEKDKICDNVIIKIIQNANNNVRDEIFLLKKAKELCDKNITNNLIYYYDSFIYDKTQIILMEYASGSLEQWLFVYRTDKEWYNCLFQILVGIHIMQKYMLTFHNDLNYKNIFFKKSYNKYINYQINNTNYYIKNNSYEFKIADFGLSKSLLIEKENTNIKENIKDNKDFKSLVILPKIIFVIYVFKQFTLNELLDIIKKKEINNNKFNIYFEKEKQDIRRRLKSLPEYVIQKSIHKSVAYYITEMNYIDISDIKENIIKNEMKMPSKKIIDFIAKIFNKNKNIPDILNENFKMFLDKDMQEYIQYIA